MYMYYRDKESKITQISRKILFRKKVPSIKKTSVRSTMRIKAFVLQGGFCHQKGLPVAAAERAFLPHPTSTERFPLIFGSIR
jgi:hypothetical protein